jgi:hypothetical protein
MPADIAHVKLGFESKAVIVEAMQGDKGRQPEFERFREMHGKPWANYLIEKLEEHAKKTGFKKVKIRVPESLYYYHYKEVDSKVKKKDREVQEEMEALYNSVAEAMGYRRKGNFFVKEL